MSIDHAISERFEFEGQLDLRATLGTRVNVARHDDQLVHEAWRASRTPHGLATVRLRATASTVHATAWGPGAHWATTQVPALLGLYDHIDAFTAHHRVVANLHRDHRGLRLGRTGLVWDALAPTILGQKVTTIEANRSWRSLARAFGEPAPGPTTLRIGPAPETLAKLAYHDLHQHGIERKRADILIACARVAAKLEAIVDIPTTDAYTRMTAIPGIGIWTASLVIGTALGDPDAIPVGDFHVPNVVSWALAREARGTDERMIELLEPYRGHRRRVVKLLHLGNISPPKYGPRTAPRDIRGW